MTIAQNRTAVLTDASANDEVIIVAPLNDNGETVKVIRFLAENVTASRNILLALRDKTVNPARVVNFTEVGVNASMRKYQATDALSFLTPYTDINIAKNCELFVKLVGDPLPTGDIVSVFVESYTIPNVA